MRKPSAPPNSRTPGISPPTDQVLTFGFDVTASGLVTLQTYSYAGGTDLAGATVAAGGFDPVLTPFDASGNFLVTNDDGPCGVVGTDPTTENCFDAYLSTDLTAGWYTVALTEADNLPLGNLADGFSQVAMETSGARSSLEPRVRFAMRRRASAEALTTWASRHPARSLRSLPPGCCWRQVECCWGCCCGGFVLGS